MGSINSISNNQKKTENNRSITNNKKSQYIQPPETCKKWPQSNNIQHKITSNNLNLVCGHYDSNEKNFIIKSCIENTKTPDIQHKFNLKNPFNCDYNPKTPKPALVGYTRPRYKLIESTQLYSDNNKVYMELKCEDKLNQTDTTTIKKPYKTPIPYQPPIPIIKPVIPTITKYPYKEIDYSTNNTTKEYIKNITPK
jgi:hypothetical protein